MDRVLEEIRNLHTPKQTAPKESFITAQEFMASVRIGRTKFDQLVAANKIQIIKKLRKISSVKIIPPSSGIEVVRRCFLHSIITTSKM